MKPLPPIDHLKEIEKNPNAVFILHQKKEYRFPVHKHSKGQLTYVEGGVAYLHAEEKTYVVPVRHYIWIPKGMVHYFQVRHAGTAVRTLYFYTFDDKSDPFYQRMGIYTVNNLLHEMILHTEQWNGMITKASKHFAFLSAIKNILPSLGTHSLPIILPTTQDERLNPVLAYLKNNISEVLTLEIVSNKFNMSERTLSRLFMAVLSISFLQYLKQLRMVIAVEMMLQTHFSMSEIAYETGYSSLSAFSNTFYQITRKRPSEFASQVR